MSSGYVKVISPEVTDLHQRIKENIPKYPHFTIKKKYLVGVVKGAKNILIYDLERSAKPLLRVLDWGETILLREFWNVEEGIKVLQDVERITALHKKQGEVA